MFNVGLIFKGFDSNVAYFVRNINEPTGPLPERMCVSRNAADASWCCSRNYENYKLTVRFTSDTQTCPPIRAKLKI